MYRNTSYQWTLSSCQVVVPNAVRFSNFSLVYILPDMY